jgi:TetR/AcrR family transcriptional repressor of bet genes
MTDLDTDGRAQAAGRKASKDIRRQQLVEATIGVLARKGYAALTIADVAREAGLSPGIVIFHFDSKERLLAASLQFLAEEYRRTWRTALSAAPATAAGRLGALLNADFDEAIFTPERLAAWIAFWGETQGRPVYDEICGPFDRERAQTTFDQCRALISEGGYGLDPELTARMLDALCDGLWYGMVSAAPALPPERAAEEARRAVALALAALFPRHFRPPA